MLLKGGTYMSDLDDLRERRKKSNERAEKAIQNIEILATESNRVADLAGNASDILDSLDKDFEYKTGLQGADIAFLFLATGLQCIRIYILNELTKREKATKIKKDDGSLTLEGKIDKKEQEWLKKFDKGSSEEPRDFYAPLNQIIATPKVPYDCTALSEKGSDYFQHANHRFATLGHDPLLGLVFGTSNILTNTISITKAPIPGVFTEKVNYKVTPLKKGGLKIGSPVIQYSGFDPVQLLNTILMFQAVEQRIQSEREAIAAALIKQVCHIGTDIFTKAGLQIPGANLILSPAQTERLTQFVDAGDLMKAGVGGGFVVLINSLISLLHGLMFCEELGISKDLYSVRTRKIILYSNVIASSCNIVTTSLGIMSGNELAVKDLDIGGIMVTIHHLIEDPKYIRQIKKDFVLGNFIDLVNGEELQLKDTSK